MNRWAASLFAIVLLLLVPLLIWTWLYNGLVFREEAAFSAWAQVESNYQRRRDLIPVLVETVSRYLRHEASTLVEVTEARGAAAAPLDAAIEELQAAQKSSARLLQGLGGKPPQDPSALQTLSEAEEKVGLSVRRLLALVENYPALRSADQFLQLQAQLEGTENRINVARMGFNEAVREYNASLEQIPTRYIVSTGDYERRAYFQTEESDRHAP